MLDSGAYSELDLYGRWTVSTAEYAAAVRRYSDEAGEVERASVQDWMCVDACPPGLARDGYLRHILGAADASTKPASATTNDGAQPLKTAQHSERAPLQY